MMKNLIVLLWLACFSGGVVQAASLGAELGDLLNYAKEHNTELAAMRYEADAASLRVQPAGALPDPVLRTELMDITNQGSNKSPSLLPSGVGSTRYYLIQTVPWFGRLDLQSEVARAQLAGARGQTAATWAELSEKIKLAYALSYYLTESIKLTRETLDLTGNLEKIAQSRYANGLARQQEVILAQIEKTDLQTQLIELANQQHHAHAGLNGLLSRPANAELAEPLRLRPLPAAAKFSALKESLCAHNPQLQLADAAIKVAARQRDLAYKNRYPGFTFGVAPTQIGSTLKSWDLMVEFNIPLQQESRRSQEGEAEALLLASAARHASLLDQMLTDLSESVSGLEAAQQSCLIITARLLPQAELNFLSAMTGYTNGRVDFSTLLAARLQILKAHQQSIKTQYEAQVRLAEIERLTGEEL